MLSIEIIIPFFTASLLLAIAPGPDIIFVLTQSTLRGAMAGIAVTIGLCTGLIVHTTAVALGVAVIFQTSALAFNVLKYAGAAYLIYLAWQAFRSSETSLSAGAATQISKFRLYQRGILMNITNPKVSIFFLAFLPQFADPARGPVWCQIIALGVLFIVATILVFGGIALVAGSVSELLMTRRRIQISLNRIAGCVFLGLAVSLAVSRR